MSVTNKEKNFISAVVYLHNDGAQAVRFFKALNAVLDQHFEQYELVAVDDACADDTIPTLRDWAKALEKPLTILHLSLHQGRETAMNAGLDAAIGDYVYEFDSTQTPYPIELVFEAYRAAMAGSDIVSVCPRSTAGSSKMFYRVFNGNSHSAYKLRTDAFRLVSRRAINRVHASSETLPYRKAAYAASGLKMTDLEFDGRLTDNSGGRFALAMDSLALYTDAGYKLSAGIAIVMMFLALAAGFNRAESSRVVILVNMLPRPMQKVCTVLYYVVTLGFFAFMVKYGIDLTMQKFAFNEMATAVAIPMGAIMICVPLCGFLGIIGTIQSFLEYPHKVAIGGDEK